ncbi:MAG TPA: type II toxin-antitoxin system VapC family toxin [Actinomycetota bacterium]
MTERVVVDASLLVGFLIAADHAGETSALLGTEVELWVPDIAPVEATNALRKLALQRRISDQVACALFDRLELLELTQAPAAVLLRGAWGMRGAMTVYDGCYADLALALTCPLVTLDRRFARACAPYGIRAIVPGTRAFTELLDSIED